MTVRILTGDCREVLKTLPDESVHCIATSPPYFGLRDYGVDGQIGLEQTPEEYIAKMVDVFREVRRVLRDDGTLWLNLGDSYAAATGGVGNNPSAKSTLNGGRGPQPGDKYAQGNEGRRVKLTPDVPAKNLLGIPWRVAFALQADGWYLRQDIIWHKPNPMPESVRDRCTKAHEYIFLLSKSERYYFDAEAIAEPAASGLPGNVTHKHTTAYEKGDVYSRPKGGLVAYAKRMRERAVGVGSNARPTKGAPNVAALTRNKRSVWTVATEPFHGAHFATFPPALIEPCILAGCPEGGTVLDPFGGAGTTGLVADRLQRDAILIELNPDYAGMARSRISGDAPLFSEVEA